MNGRRQGKQRRKSWYRALTLLTVLLLAGDLGGCGKGRGDYPQNVVDAFMEGCTHANPNNAGRQVFCRCMISEIGKRVPYAQFEEFDRRFAAGEAVTEFENRMAEAAAICRG